MSSSFGFGCGDHYFQLLVFLPPFVSLLVLAENKTLMNSSIK
jgi:hypothetical protein